MNIQGKMSNIPPVTPEVLLLLVNAYKSSSDANSKALQYTEAILDNTSKRCATLESQNKSLEEKIRSLESQLLSRVDDTPKVLIDPTKIVDNVGPQ